MSLPVQAAPKTSLLIPSFCANCKKSDQKLHECARCHFVKYCNQTCQKAHWPIHKLLCSVKKPDEQKSAVIQKLSQEVFPEKKMPINGLRLIENFISPRLHDEFVAHMEENGIPEQNDGHYDGYTFKDNEVYSKMIGTLVSDIFTRLRNLKFFGNDKPPSTFASSIVAYEKDGYIRRHIDSSLVSGSIVIAVSFNSPIVVNFYHEKSKKHHKIFVPPCSLYSISGEARYEWSHEILKDEKTFNSVPFERKKRYVILFTPPGPKSNCQNFNIEWFPKSASEPADQK